MATVLGVRLKTNNTTGTLNKSNSNNTLSSSANANVHPATSYSSAAGGSGSDLSPDDIPEEARKALLQVAEGVAHLHSQRIVHRDLKPHNILLALPENSSDVTRLSLNQLSDSSQDSSTGTTAAASSEDVDIQSLKELGKYLLKISDMGLGKHLDSIEGGSSTFSGSFYQNNGNNNDGNPYEDSTRTGSSSSARGRGGSGAVGTVGWQAPELLSMRQSLAGIVGLEEALGGGEEEGSGMDESEDSPEGPTEDMNNEKQNMNKSGSTSNLKATDETPVRKASSSNSLTPSNEVETAANNESTKSDEPPPLSRVELRNIRNKAMQTVDIFSLGCVFHYVLIPGEHPFGKWFEREANIMNSKPDLSHLRGVPDAFDLISRMVDNSPENRPTANQVCRHPFFWNSQKRLEFLVDFSDRLEHELPDSPLVLSIESNASQVVGRSWDRKLHKELLEDIGKYRKYDCASVRDCLRLIRNKRHHFNELANSVKALMSPLPSGFILYFETRFPKLLLHCVTVCCRYLHQDKDFSQFCKIIAPLYKLPTQTMNYQMGSTSNTSSMKSTSSNNGPILTSTSTQSLSATSLKIGSYKGADDSFMATNDISTANNNNNNNNSDNNESGKDRSEDLELQSNCSSKSNATDRSKKNDGSNNPPNVTDRSSAQIESQDFENSEPGNRTATSSTSETADIVTATSDAHPVGLERMPARGGADTGSTKSHESSSTVTNTASVTASEGSHVVDRDVTVWAGSALSQSIGCIGWWRESEVWATSTTQNQLPGGRLKGRPNHITRSSTDAKYRSRLCTHWEITGGLTCPMRKKGKCDFAHGPLELRVKEGRRGKWGQHAPPSQANDSANPTASPQQPTPQQQYLLSLTLSGGEDVLGAARSIEKVRAAEGSVSDFEKSARKGGGNNGSNYYNGSSSNSGYTNNRGGGTPFKKGSS